MENITKLLDETKHAVGVETDYALAKKLDLPRARICDYYKGNRAPDEFACLKIAEALGQPLDTIIARVKAATEKDEKRREVWENYMKRLGGIAASFVAGIFIVVTLIVTPSPAEAANTSFYSDKSAGIQITRTENPVDLSFIRNHADNQATSTASFISRLVESPGLTELLSG